MLTINKELKQRIVVALLEQRAKFGGTDAQFAKQFDINGSVFSRIKNGEETDGLLREAQWMNMARRLQVPLIDGTLKVARTKVFDTVADDVEFCKTYSKGRICADFSGIGKTVSAKYLSRTLKNCFHMDAKQSRQSRLFIKAVARMLGVEIIGTLYDIKENIKYSLHQLEKPIIIIDDAGYLTHEAYMELLELVDSTEGICGWYQIGDDSLMNKIEKGISNRKLGYRAMFSRFSNNYTTCVPAERNEKINFYKALIRDIATVNAKKGMDINKIVTQCLMLEKGEVKGDMRRLESLLILNS